MTYNKKKWSRLIGLVTLLLLGARASNAQCVDPSSSINFTNTGQANAGYATIYVLTNGNDIIQNTVTSPFTAPVAEGNYKVYAVNYRTGETDPVITAGNSIHAIGGSCVAISATPMEFSVCICVGAATPISFAINNSNTAGLYTTRYVVAGSNGNLLSSNTTGSFTAPTGAGEFQVYSINYKTGETDPVLTPGTNINAIGGSCVTKSVAPARFKVCNSYDYGNLPVTGGTIWPVAYAGVACILSGTAPMNYDINSNPFVAVWAGTQISTEAQSPASAVDAGNDGLVLPGTVSPSTSFNYTVTLNANLGGRMAYYRLWFDWNNDGDFTNDVDGNNAAATYTGSALSAGTVDVVVPVLSPAAVGSAYKVRLAVSDAPIPDLYRDNGTASLLRITNGEIEDYSGAGLSTLPLKLVSFTAARQNATALVNWSTSFEENTSRFILERSGNGAGSWQEIATIAAAGNTSELRKYQYVDEHPLEGNNYYRLRMIDIDGAVDFSNIQTVRFDGAVKIMVYPNPVKDIVQVALPAGYGEVTVVIRDLTSREVMKKVLHGGTRQAVQVSSLLPGVYTIEIVKAKAVVLTEKLVKN